LSLAGSGSGIPDVKAFLNGVDSPIFASFFRIRTFISKARLNMISEVLGSLKKSDLTWQSHTHPCIPTPLLVDSFICVIHVMGLCVLVNGQRCAVITLFGLLKRLLGQG
jgi:hypothetical protein